jgi:hypothetical protein
MIIWIYALLPGVRERLSFSPAVSEVAIIRAIITNWKFLPKGTQEWLTLLSH